MVQQSSHFVVLTGAGISTSAGIPDFRGPGGIWTRQQELEKRQRREKRKRKAPEPENTKAEPESVKAKPAAASPEELPAGALDFGAAQPTLTHYALAEMAQRGKLKHVVTQNVDALHQRSGLNRDNLSVLHGCIFEEKCESCGQLELFDKEVTTISCELTGKKCKSCGGGLRDTLLDWEDELPEDQLARSEQHCVEADLVMTLGTSLRIEPAGSLPQLSTGGFVIVNLQTTPYDEQSKLLIRAPVDKVMAHIMEQLYGVQFSVAADGKPQWKSATEE